MLPKQKSIYGVSYTFKKWTDRKIAEEIMKIANQFNPPKMPTRAEAENMYGNCGLSVAISKNGGFEYWAKRLGLPQGNSETALAIQIENEFAEALTDRGYDAELTSTKRPYDILVDGCVKVDVKAANTSYVRGCPIHAYRLAKRQHTCDFYIFHEVDTDTTYIVPAHICSGQVQVEMGEDSSKYMPFKEAWDLIGKASDFYKSL